MTAIDTFETSIVDTATTRSSADSPGVALASASSVSSAITLATADSHASPSTATPIDLYNSGVRAQRRGDAAEARRLFAQAANRGHPKSIHNLGLLTQADDAAAAAVLYRRGAAKGLAESQVRRSCSVWHFTLIGNPHV